MSKNTLAQLVALASTTISKLLITIVIARMYGPREVGDFAFVITFTILFTFLSTAGITFALIREIATHRDQVNRYAGNALSIVTLTGLAAIPIMVIMVALMNYPPYILLAIALAGLALAFDGMAQVLNAVFYGFERMELGAVIVIVQEIAFLIIGSLVLLMQMPFIWIFAVYAPAKLSGLIVGLPMYARVFGAIPHPRFEWQFIKQLFRTSIPYAINMALGPVYLRIDVFMLSFFQGSLAVGLYEAATNIFYRLNVFARTFNMALMPLMAREHDVDEDRTNKYINAAAKAQFVLGIPLTVLCIMLAERLVLFIYGQNFKSSGLVFGLMASIIVLRFIDNTLATVLTALGLQSKRALAVAAVAVFNIGLNLWMIPRYSFIGATITTILTEAGFFIFLYLMVSQKISQPFAMRLILKPGFAGAVMALIVWWLHGLPLVLIVLLSGMAYLICLLTIGTFSRDEIFLFLGVSRLYHLSPSRVRVQIRNNLKQREELKGG